MHTKQWTKLITRRLAVQVAIAWNYGFGKQFLNRYNAIIPNTLIYYDGTKTDYFVDENELNEFNIQLDKNLENPEFVHSMIPEAKEFVEERYESIKNMIKDANQLSNPKLAALYSKFAVHHSNYYTRMWMVFRICERVVNKVEEMLIETIKDKDKVKEMSRIFSTPLKPNDVTDERIDMLKLLIRNCELDDEKLRQELAKHTNKYQHIPMFDFDHKPFDYKHFANEIEKIKNPIDELKRIEISFEKRKQDFEIALHLVNGNKELYNMIKMLKKAVVLRDHRDMVRQKLNLAIKELYQTIGARMGLSVEETALLTNVEIEDHLNRSTSFDKNEIKNRKKSFLLFQTDVEGNEKIEILSNKKAIQKAEELKLYKTMEDEKIENAIKETIIIQGIAANTKRIGGIAKIVHTNLDFDKVKEGDIIISSMTRQDFVPVMRRASGVVTNEGSITCHTAIIARELGLPCVVGTQTATQIINDGDLIFIDGEKGHVEIVRKGHRED